MPEVIHRWVKKTAPKSGKGKFSRPTNWFILKNKIFPLEQI